MGENIHQNNNNKPFIKFNLYKRNLETNVAIDRLARALDIPRRCFEMAGFKDKRAESLQQISLPAEYFDKLDNSIFDANPQNESLFHANRSNFENSEYSRNCMKQRYSSLNDLIRDIRIGGFEFCDGPLAVGDSDFDFFSFFLFFTDSQIF